MDRADIKKLWAEHGGETHGPRVETVTMPEHLFWGFVDALITAARRPDDMVLVPREPTREMVAAGDFVLFEASLSDGTFGGDAIDTYRAMLSAAPGEPDHG